MSTPNARLLAAATNVIRKEFAAFERGYSERPVPRVQEMRAGCISWLATFLPESFDDDLAQSMGARVAQWGEQPDYRVDGWFRLPALEVALYNLAVATGEPHRRDIARFALDRVIVNIDHHNSGLRAYILQCLALAAPNLAFNDAQLRGRVESLLASNQLYSDAAVALYLATEGSLAEKRAWGTEWKDRVQEGFGRAQLRDLAAGAPLTNPLFADIAEVERYVWLRLVDTLANVACPADLQVSPGAVAADLMRTRIATHALIHPAFRIAE